MLKEEKIELKRRLEKIEEEEDSPMVSISLHPNLSTKIPPNVVEHTEI